MKQIPVVLDTDIGSDIDDVWALAMLLKSPELRIELITTATADTVYRAKIVARMLEVVGRTEIPIGIGFRQTSRDETHARWVEGYDLAKFPGTIREDGVEALVRTILDAREPITLIAIGPLTNIAAALEREPRLAERTRFAGMFGSVHRRKEGVEGAIAEYNVVTDIKAAQRVFAAPWIDMKITPLDTCGQVCLKGERYRRLRYVSDPLLRAVMENYRCWAAFQKRFDPNESSSILFDTVAVHLAYSTRFLKMRRMGLRVTDDGFTREDAAARAMDVASDWADLDAFEEFLVERLLAPVGR